MRRGACSRSRCRLSMRGHGPCDFAHSLKNHIDDVRFVADGGRIPHEFVVLLSWIEPGRLAAFEPLANLLRGFTKHRWNVFVGMQAVADEERYDDNVFRARQTVTITDARFFFHEHGVNLPVELSRADQFDLTFDGLARILIVV